MAKDKREKENERSLKAQLQQERSGVFKDRKRRTFYIEPRTGETYQILSEDKFVFIYDGRIFFALLPIALMYSIEWFNKIAVSIIAILIYYGIVFYYKFKVVQGFKKVTLPPEVQARSNSMEVLKSRRMDLFLKIIMSVIIVVMIATASFGIRLETGSLTTSDMIGLTLSLFLALVVTIESMMEYFKVQSRIKTKKKEEKKD